MRKDDWLPRLLAYVEAVRAKPYNAVAHNCALFVAGAIREMRGDDPVSSLGVRLSSERDVVEVLSARGGVKGLADEYLGQMLPPLRARRGDVVIKDGDGGDTLGLCMGTHALFLGLGGLQRRALKDCAGCWEVN